MAATDFPAWYSAGIFGGIGCALLSALAIGAWTLWRRRGVTGQVIGALLVCAVASALDIGPLLWIEYRLNVYGPTLSAGEVGAALAAAALVGWMAPLAAICWYLLLATPTAPAPARLAQVARQGAISPAALDDPARARAVSDGGQPWGALTPVAALPDAATNISTPRPIALTHALTLIGRELDNDIVLDDDRVSRRHAELRWERGRVELGDYGSLNGTRVNQQAVRGRLPLRDGDLIEFGHHRYHLALQPDEPGAMRVADASAAAALETPETRKTASISGAFGLGTPLLQMTLIQGEGVPGQAITWPLAGPVTTIGRDPSCGIPLADTSISRIHAQITRQPAGHFIADLQSSNGVTLNGSRLNAPTQLFAGDIVALGDCLLRCEEVAAQGRRTPAAAPMGTPAIEAGGQAVTPPDAPPDAVHASPTVAMSPTGAPSFHLRIAPGWSARRESRPRLAPPRLAPTPRQPGSPSDEQR
jgi:pSer/pThr/pTyr-binding forkhead associated (FHA) protein